MPLAGGIAAVQYRLTAVDTSASGTFTAETVVDTIVAALVSGKTYEVHYHGLYLSSVANDTAGVHLREDSVSGTDMTSTDVYLPVGSSRVWVCHLYAEYTAGTTGNKTFVATGQRRTGTGNIQRYASASAPAYFVVKEA
jgi:hypothetical protein